MFPSGKEINIVFNIFVKKTKRRHTQKGILEPKWSEHNNKTRANTHNNLNHLNNLTKINCDFHLFI